MQNSKMKKTLKKRPTAEADRLYRRIVERLRDLGKTEHAASIAAGLGADFIRDIGRRGSVPSATNLDRLARTLSTSSEWLLGAPPTRAKLIHNPPTRGERLGLPYMGEVAAGHWLDIDDAKTDTPHLEDASVLPDPRYPAGTQFALLVRGTSINRVAGPGDTLICVSILEGAIEPMSGDIVIVERRRMQEGQREVTAKRLRRKGDVFELFPDSDDPRWQKPIIFDPKEQTDDEQVAIIAVVTGVYRPVRGTVMET